MPDLKLDDLDPIVDDSRSKTTSADLAPPMQPDIPSLEPAKFTQPVEPPPPVGIDPRAIKVGPFSSPPKLAPFNVSSLDRTPEALFQPQPVYPYGMRAKGESGWATVRFVVDSHGNVVDAVVRESSQHEFDENCLQAVHRWRFKPGTKGGRAVSFWAEENFRFTLSGSE